jgi:asparagine synthetase B (glutamine-hydrolysing)
MTEPGKNAPIALPQWYARLAATRDPADAGGSASASVRHVGPLTIVRPDLGCEVFPFGASEDPGAVIFDGYLFDREALAAELDLPGTTPSSHIAAVAYERWGTGMFDRLDGRYLVAVWDPGAGRLLIGHDALGHHPVFYTVAPDGVWFSSNILALASSGRVPRHPDRLSLAFAMVGWWPEAGRTYFGAISRVRPGSYLSVSPSGTVAQHKYWDPLPEDDEPYLPDGQALDQFEPALKQAVERRMRLGAQGIMLSGGVDSVTIAALAAEYWTAQQTPPLVAVSARTGGPLSYEELMQSQVTERLAMPHLISTTPEWTGGRDHVSLSLELTPELPSPSRIHWVGTYTRFYRRTAAQQLRVLLTGAGGDNWLGVAEAHAADLLRRLQLAQLVRFMKSDVATGGASIGHSIRRLLWTWGLRPHLDTLSARLAPDLKMRYHRRKWYARLPGWLCPDLHLRDELVHRLLDRRTPPLTSSGTPPRSYYRQAVRAVSNPYMHYESEIAYHMETACGLRLLSPYHDRRLVWFFNRIHPRVLLLTDRYKGLLRPIVAKHLPGLGLENQRKHYPRDEQRQQLEQFRRAVAMAWRGARFDALGRAGVVDPATAPSEGEGLAGKDFNGLARMFIMLSAERWLSTHTDV